MECDLKYDTETETVLVKLTGELTEQGAKQAVATVAAVVRQHSCRRVLNDARGMSIKLDTFQLYHMAGFMAEAGFGSVRRALVFARDLEDAKFYETVSVNRAQFMKVFTDMDEAKRWLASE